VSSPAGTKTKRRSSHSSSSNFPPNPARIAKIAACDRAYRFLQNLLLPLSNLKVLSLVTTKVTCLN
jgi:hypothetical protein